MTQGATDVFEPLGCWTGVIGGVARWYCVKLNVMLSGPLFVRDANCKGRVL